MILEIETKKVEIVDETVKDVEEAVEEQVVEEQVVEEEVVEEE